MNILLLLVIILKGFECSEFYRSVRFNFNNEEEDKFRVFMDNLNSDEPSFSIDDHKGLFITRANDLEAVLKDQILNSSTDFRIPKYLFDYGIRIQSDFMSVYLKTLILHHDKPGALALLFSLLTFEKAIISRQIHFGQLLDLFIDLPEKFALQAIGIFWTDVDFNELGYMEISALCVKVLLLNDRRELLVFLLDRILGNHKRIILRNLLRLSVQSDRLYVMEICAKANVSSIILKADDRWKGLLLAAETGNYSVTKFILSGGQVIRAYILNHLDDELTPWSIAKSLGHDEIWEFYQPLINHV